MKLYIKYMVSHRCKLVVMSALEGLGLHYDKVELGEVTVVESLTQEQHDQLAIALMKLGLELMDNQKSILIEKIKNIIIEMVHYSDEVPRVNFSDYLS